jgi:hypothetical protein
MVMGCKSFLAVLVFLAGCSAVFAQAPAIGAGRVELGGFPGGGTFLVGGNNNTEVGFTVYTAGGGLTYYLAPRVSVEAEMTGSIGMAQNVIYMNAPVNHTQMPNPWTWMGNVQVYPGGTTSKRAPFYVTAGAGLVALQPRVPDAQFGYGSAAQCPCPGWQYFKAEDVGAGIKIFRDKDAPNWGFRADYRLLFINENSSAPPFFAQAKSRMGSRVYVGLLYTWKQR